MTITRRPLDKWVIDFGTSMTEADASFFELPSAHLEHSTKISRIGKREPAASRWWLHTRPRPELRNAISPLERYICTPRVSKHRLFVFLSISVLPDSATAVFARSDDTTFGILHSRFHELWSLNLCTWMGKGNDPRYTPSTCFETFPFPAGLSPADTKPKNDKDTIISFTTATPANITDVAKCIHAQAIADAAFTLNSLRENWLNPDEWADWVITEEEQKAGFPKRPVAKAGHEAELKKRTLTNLYNAKPQWLITAHQAIDQAVATAYGWQDYTPEMTDAEILQRLLKLNLES